ncbi:MAG TPA: hypothetical protein DCY88_24960 [Cyanobacteria bacterium UBA11372]|nr:hypothetical protein [Cyanobacteria bacterium UBA11372]
MTAPRGVPFTVGVCPEFEVPTNRNGELFPLPGGERIRVEMQMTGQETRTFRNAPPYNASVNERVLVASNTSNDFRLIQPDVLVNTMTGERDFYFPGRRWFYESRNQQFATLENSEGVRVYIGQLIFIGIVSWDDGGTYKYENGSRTLIINGIPQQPFNPPPDPPPDPPDDPPPPPCDIPISSDFDLGYFCMTRQEYSRFINDIDRVEENLRRFQ